MRYRVQWDYFGMESGLDFGNFLFTYWFAFTVFAQLGAALELFRRKTN